MSTFQRKLQKDRTNDETSNAGLKWETADDTYLVDSSKNGISITDIAKNLKRTEGSIKTRLVINILNICNENKTDLEELCTLHNISSREVANYEQKKEQREKKKVTRTNEKSSGFPSSDLLEVCDGLSQLNKKLDTVLENQCTILKKIK
tara:strand:- start:3 stop:449 length:447 start_codon:yes stop_codon:yes gene_type:complete